MESSVAASLSRPSFDDDNAFERLFKEHFKALHAYARVMLRDDDLAEEMVQNIFLRLWERRDLLNVQTSMKAYLYKMVHNDCLNYFKRNKTKAKYEHYAIHTMDGKTSNAAHKLELGELEHHIAEALNDLPLQCRTIFQMSRFDELKYKEIASQLGISVKTVENQMGKALKIMRVKLADFLPLVILWLVDKYL